MAKRKREIQPSGIKYVDKIKKCMHIAHVVPQNPQAQKEV